MILNWGNHSEVIPLIGVRDGTNFFLIKFKLVGGRALLRRHESLLREFFKSHISEVVDSLSPGVFSHIVVTNFNEGLSEDLESEFRLGGVGTLILSVDLASDCLSEDTFTIDEVTVFDVEVDVGQGQS